MQTYSSLVIVSLFENAHLLDNVNIRLASLQSEQRTLVRMAESLVEELVTEYEMEEKSWTIVFREEANVFDQLKVTFDSGLVWYIEVYYI